MKIYSSPDMNNLPIKNPLCYTENEINELFDLTDEEVVELTKVISDQVAINKVYSSQKTEERLAEILIEANKFATEQLGKSNFLSIDLATSVDEVVDETVLYLIDDGTGTNTYNQYVLIRGNAIPLGNTQCDLSNYVTNDQLETKLKDYAKKNEVLSASDIVTRYSTNVTDSQVFSAKAINDKFNSLVLEKNTIEGENGFTYAIILDDDMNVKGYPANYNTYTLEITEDNTQIQLDVLNPTAPMTYDIAGNVGVNIRTSTSITLNTGTYKVKLINAYLSLGNDKITGVVVGKNITNYKHLFSNCDSLTTLDLSNFNTSNVTNMHSMFNSCTNLTSLDLSNFDTSNVTSMNSMFDSCTNLTSLDLSNFDTSNVTDMNSMFNNCTNLTSLDLSNFDTSNVTNMRSMFNSCVGLTALDVSNFDTSNVTNIRAMFAFCRNLTTLDVSNFDTSNVTTMEYMFYNCYNLTTLKLGSSFIVSKMTDYESLFTGCTALNKIQIPADFPADSRTFIEARLTDAGILANVTFETY